MVQFREILENTNNKKNLKRIKFKWLWNEEYDGYLVLPEKNFILVKRDGYWYVLLAKSKFELNPEQGFKKRRTALKFIDMIKNYKLPIDMSREEIEKELKNDWKFSRNIEKLHIPILAVARKLLAEEENN